MAPPAKNVTPEVIQHRDMSGKRQRRPVVDTTSEEDDEPQESLTGTLTTQAGEELLRGGTKRKGTKSWPKRRVGRPGDPEVAELMERCNITICNAELVEYVHQRPPLWDNCSAEYKVREKRNEAWAEVFSLVAGDTWTYLTDKPRRMIGEEIAKRWRSLRDRFKKDVNLERNVASGSVSAPLRRHYLYEALSFLIPTMAMRATVCSTAGPRTATTAVATTASRRAEDELDSGAHRPPPPPATVATRRGTFPSMRLHRQLANRVEMSDLITTTNNSLATLEASLNRYADQQTTELRHFHQSVGSDLRRLQQTVDTDLRRLQQSVERFFPQDGDDSMFVMGTLHSIRMIHPAYRQEARIAIHHLISDFLGRPPPPAPRVLMPHFNDHPAGPPTPPLLVEGLNRHPEEPAMGSLSSRLLGQDSSSPPAGSCECRKRKRSLECQCDTETDDELEDLLNTPRRKKLKSTSKYIYQTLFLNGENSDIKICALGKEWNLHKIYLCQSGYFSSMFCGSWKESSMTVIELEIPDHNIDAEALQVAFGSLYRDDVLLKPSRVIAILAAACMLQLDGLIQQCGETMKETISVQTVCSYSTAAGVYGLDSLKKKCLEWLLNNLMTHQSVDLFKELSINMMKRLICSPDLLVMQVEMDVYTALKKWMFLKLVPLWSGSLKQLLSEADTWFSKRRKELEDTGISFLETEQCYPFVPVFKHLRMQYIISDLASARIIERDALIPSEWLSSVYKQQWFTMLRAEQDNDTGPQEINKEELENNSMRCGRRLVKDGDYCWRWTGFNFGFDLLVTYTNRYIIFKRNTLNQPCSGSVSLQPQRNIAFRLRLVSFDANGKVICNRTSGYQILSLEKDQEQVVMNLDSRLLVFPLYICCNFLYTSPEKRVETEGQAESPDI